MLVRDVMQSNVVTVTADTLLSTAAGVMSQHRIRHLPVVDGDRLLGVISDRDLKASAASLAAGRRRIGREAPDPVLTAGDVLRPTTITVGSTAPVEDAAGLMATHRIGSLPVVDAERLVGLVTDTDLLACFAGAAGACESSTP
jgi:acetoin utilization protein AcuB